VSVTSGLEIIAKNANYRKVTFADSNSYSVYMVIQKAVYSSDTDLPCIPPSVDLSISPLSINVNISAQSISQLSVNVAAWTAGTLAVNISAQSVGNITVNLAAISATTSLNVAIASSAVTLQVNIASQSANLNVNLAAQSLGTVAISINALNVTGNLPVNIAAQSVGNVAVNIAAQSVGNITTTLAAITTTASLNVAIASAAVTLNVNISSQSANLNISIQASSVTLTVTGSSLLTQLQGYTGTAWTNLSANTSGQLAINLVASSATVNVNISSQSANLNVAIAANNAGNITVSLAAIATTANLNVNLNASAITLNVNITNASITITGSVSISGVPAITINAGTATIGSINQIVSPVTSRSKVAAGYQENSLYLNHSPAGEFVSGSNSDSSSNKNLGAVTRTPFSDVSGSNLSYHNTIWHQFQTQGSGYLLSIQFYNASATTAAVAIYTDSAGAPGTLVKDYGITFNTTGSAVNTLNVNDSSTLLSASTTYWIAISEASANVAITTNASVLNTGYNAIGYGAGGFPATAPAITSAGLWFSNSTTASVQLLVSNSFTVSLTYSLSQVQATTFNGQQVLKFGIFPDQGITFNISSISIVTKGTTAGTIRSATPPNQNGVGGVANSDVFVTDAGSVNLGNPITLNAGDTFQIVLSFTISGASGAGNIWLDNLNGVSYIVVPLV